MKSIEFPGDDFDAGQKWANELDRYGVSSVGFMIGPETYDEFKESRRRFPGYFLGYINVQPTDPDAPKKIRKAAEEGFYGIKLYPSSWRESMSTTSSSIPYMKRLRGKKWLYFATSGSA